MGRNTQIAKPNIPKNMSAIPAIARHAILTASFITFELQVSCQSRAAAQPGKRSGGFRHVHEECGGEKNQPVNAEDYSALERGVHRR